MGTAGCSGATDGEDPFSDVGLTLDADPGLLPVVRALAADLGRQVGFDADDVADFRLAVDEVCSWLIGQAQAGSMLCCLFRVLGSEVRLTAEVDSDDPPQEGAGALALRLLRQVSDAVVTTATEQPDGGARLVTDVIKRKAEPTGS